MSTLTFEDIKSRRLAGNWNVLNDLIDHKGFPPGYIVGRRRCFVKIAESDKATDGGSRVGMCCTARPRLGQARQDASPRWRHSSAHHF